MRRSAASPLPDHAFEPSEFFVRKAGCPCSSPLMKLSTLCFDLSFPDVEIASFNAFTSAHILAVVSFGVGGNGL